MQAAAAAAAAIVAANSDVVANHSFDSSLLSLPCNVLLHDILGRLPLYALVACGLVCKHLQCYSKKALTIIEDHDKNNNDKTGILWWRACPRWVPILLSAYEHGTADVLRWLQVHLKYPLLDDEYYNIYKTRKQVNLFKREDQIFTVEQAHPVENLHALFMIFAMNNNKSALQMAYNQLYESRDVYYTLLLQSGCLHVQAAEQGLLELFEWAFQTLPEWRLTTYACGYRIVEAAVRGGHLNFIQWAMDKEEFRFNAEAVAYTAARFGHVHVIEWLLKSGTAPELDETFCVKASICKSPRVLQRAIDKGYQFDVQKCFKAAVGAGSIETAKFIVSAPERKQQLIDYFYSTTTNTYIETPLYTSAEHGLLEITQWICSQFPADLVNRWREGYRGREVLMSAVKSGNLKLLQWLLANGFSWDQDAFVCAVKYRHVHVLQWMFEQKDRYRLPLDNEGLYTPGRMLGMTPVSASVVLWMARCGMVKPIEEHALQEFCAVQRQDAVTEWLIQRQKHFRCLNA